MPEDKHKPFDMTHPNQVTPHSAGRPVIVGHHPVMSDPMLRPMHHTPPQPQPSLPPQPAPTDPYSPQPPLADPQPQPQPHPYIPQPTAVPPQPVQPAAQPFEPIGALPTQPAAQVPPPAAGQPPMPPGSPAPHMAHHELPIANHKSKGFGIKKVLLFIVLPLLALFVLFYLLIDAGVINSNVNLPFHIFKKQQNQVASNGSNTASTTPPPASSSVPAGFSAYKDSNLPFTFNYPTLWGTPTVTTEQGYSKRGGTNKADGTYAYLVNFATNKDVQIAVTSAKYLPPTRPAALYYDFLGWCTGQNSSEYFKSILTFTSASGVDTPSSVTCDQGPLTDVTKIDTSTIVQINTKAADGSNLGSIYTKNLDSTDIPVVRIKDATGKNGDSIKIILNTNQSSNQKTTP